jgi:hypothetical protein
MRFSFAFSYFSLAPFIAAWVARLRELIKKLFAPRTSARIALE